MEELTQEEIIWLKNEKKRYDYSIQVTTLLNEKQVLLNSKDDNKEVLITEKDIAIDELVSLMDDLN